jgi:hypothetical protein
VPDPRTIRLRALNGEHTNGQFKEQPEGTSRRLLNMLPRDARDDVDRMCQRPGVSKLIANPASAGSRIRAVQGIGYYQNTGELIRGPLLKEVDFTSMSNTSAGDLGPDLAVYESPAAISPGTDYNINFGSWGLHPNGITSGNNASGPRLPIVGRAFTASTAQITGGFCVDNQSFLHLGAGVNMPVITAAMLNIGSLPSLNYCLQLQITANNPADGSRGGHIGFLLHANTGAYTIGNADDAVWFGVGKRGGDANAQGGAGDKEAMWQSSGFNDYHGTPFEQTNKIYPNSAPLEEGASPYNWVNGQTYLLELRKVGTYVEFYIDGILALVTSDITGTAASPTSANLSQTDLGFYFYNSGGSANDAWKIERFALYECDRSGADRDARVVVAVNNDIRISNANAADLWETPVGGSDVLSSLNDPFFILGPGPASGGARYVFVLDGTQYLYVNPLTLAVTSWTSSGLPDQSGNKARYGLLWDGRVVMYGLAALPDQWYMSARNDPFDWQPTPATPSINQAVAGDNSDAGIPTDDLTCIAPIGEKWLTLASESALWFMDGNPADTGRLVPKSTATGIIGPRAWAQDQPGNLHFISERGHFFWSEQGGDPEPISLGRIDKFFTDFDPMKEFIQCEWDALLDGLWILRIPTDPTRVLEHRFWSRRTNSYSPAVFADNVGPACASMIPNDRRPGGVRIIWGCDDGYVRYIDPAADTDDGVPIEARVMFGPVTNGVGERALLSGVSVELPPGSTNVECRIYADNTAEELADNPTLRAKRLWARAATVNHLRQIVGRPALGVELYRNRTGGRLVIEDVVAEFERRGPVRRLK